VREDDEPIFYPVKKPEDLDLLHEKTKGVIGQNCWRVWLGYGDELKMDIGAKVPVIIAGRNFGGEQGEWFFGSRGTDWKLTLNEVEVANSGEDAEVAQPKLQVLLDALITNFEAHFPDLSLTITFSNNYRLTVLPKPEDDTYEIAYWELFTPDDVVDAWPGPFWRAWY
jgi:hypothetical protein